MSHDGSFTRTLHVPLYALHEWAFGARFVQMWQGTRALTFFLVHEGDFIVAWVRGIIGVVALLVLERLAIAGEENFEE